MTHTYSSQAEKVISALKEFDREAFESWYDEHINIVGGGHVLSYIALREEEEGN